MTDETQANQPAPRRHSRWGLYLPFLILALIAAGWSGFWFIARDRVNTAIDTWITREASLGRVWSCGHREVGGFPFRFELTCAGPRFKGNAAGGPVAGSLKEFRAVAQAYQPNRVIAEVQGPLMVEGGGRNVSLTWETFRASVSMAGGDFDEFAIAVEKPAGTTGEGADAAPLFTAAAYDGHIRRDPNRPATENAFDYVGLVKGARVPALEAYVPGPDPADLEVQARLIQAIAFGPGSQADQLERWRAAGGRLDIVLLRAAKGPSRLEGRGQFGLDELHRPQGEAQVSVAGLNEVIGPLLGFGGSIGGGPLGGALGGALADALGQGGGRGEALGSLIAGGLDRLVRGKRPPQREAQAAPEPGPTGLTPLPPIRIAYGKVAAGPFVVTRVPPLY